MTPFDISEFKRLAENNTLRRFKTNPFMGERGVSINSHELALIAYVGTHADEIVQLLETDEYRIQMGNARVERDQLHCRVEGLKHIIRQTKKHLSNGCRFEAMRLLEKALEERGE